MVYVTVLKDQNEQYIGFECIGHAGYAEAGEDIVCAGVSVLVINTVNSLSRFTKEKFKTELDEETGRIGIRFCHPAGHDARLLVDSMVLGLQGVQENYGAGYITLDFKEV